MDISKHFSEEKHHGLLEDIHVKIIDRLAGGGTGYVKVSGNISQILSRSEVLMLGKRKHNFMFY